MTDPALMSGDGWVRCCICGQLHERPFPNLAVDCQGTKWDACKGTCAADAGIRLFRWPPVQGEPAS